MTLPVGLERIVDADELKAPQRGETQGPTGSKEFTTLMNQINGEGKSERVDLRVGGYVTIPLSKYNWALYESNYDHDHTTEKEVVHAEFGDTNGGSEAVLQINRQTGEVLSVHVSRRGETITGKDW